MATEQQHTALAVVPAAGIGRRMRSDLPKQYLPLAGRTVIEHTLQVLLDSALIERVIVGIGAGDAVWHTLPIASHPDITAVIGGGERVQTVLNCLQSVPIQHHSRWVMVHDAVRPCLKNSDIATLWNTLQSSASGGLLAVPLVDTIKRADCLSVTSLDSGLPVNVATTPDRRYLWAAHTPQMFRLGELLSALQQARQRGCEITDESSAMEALGIAPTLVAGSVENLKITRREDLPLAEFYLRRQQLGSV